MTLMDLGNQQQQREHRKFQGKTDDLARRIEQEKNKQQWDYDAMT